MSSAPPFAPGPQLDALTAALAAEADVTVEVGGRTFCNESNFGLLALNMAAWRRHSAQAERWGRPDWWRGVWSADVQLPKRSVIRLASTPPSHEQDPTWREAVKGGLIHEVLHSRYTQRGPVDLVRVAALWADPARQDWARLRLPARQDWLKGAWNVFEDLFIERAGRERWLGASRPLCVTQRWLMDLEEASWRPRAVSGGPSIPASERDRILLILRDCGKAALHQEPDLADPDLLARRYGEDLVREWSAAPWGEALMKRALLAEDSYHTLALALDLALALEARERPPEARRPPPPQEDDKPEGRTEAPSGSPSGAAPEEPPSEGSSPSSPSEGSSSGAQDQASGPEDESDQGSSDQGNSDQGNSVTAEEGSPSGDPVEGEEEGGHAVFHSPLDALAAEAARALEEYLGAGIALDEDEAGDWPHSYGRGRWPAPWTRSAPMVKSFQPAKEVPAHFSATEAAARALLGAARGRLIALLRGQEKCLPEHRQKRGSRLSSRSAHEVLTKPDPSQARPWVTRERHPRRNSSACLMLDLSGSMRAYTTELTLLALALNELFQSLNLPHEIVGYTSTADSSLRGRDVEGAVRTYDHSDKAVFHILKPWGLSSAPPELRASWATWPTMGGTPLPDALTWAYRSLSVRKEDQRLAIVFTDGEPSYGASRYSSAQWISLMGLQIRAMREAGLDVMMICYLGEDDEADDEDPVLARLRLTNPDLLSQMAQVRNRRLQALTSKLEEVLPPQNLILLRRLKDLPAALASWMSRNLRV